MATCIVLLSGIAVWGTAAGLGGFHRGDANESLLMLEVFMATISMTMLPLAAVVAESRLASRAKDEFLAMLSHELRTPLAAITNAVSVLEARDRAWARGSEGSGARRRHVLVIEDNADVRESLVLILEQAGYRVTCAGDGPGGVEAALRSRPEVMLVDVGLPGFDGHEVARRVRAAPESASSLLVALTGYGQEQDQRQAREAGFDLHLVKPVDPERLLALLADKTCSPRR